MENLVQIFIPLVMFIMMAIIGTELAWVDFQQVASRLWLVVVAALGQLLVLPMLVFSVMTLTQEWLVVPVFVMAAMLIMATGPGGGLSNILVSHAHGNIALSIVLTTTASLLSLLTMPVVLAWVLPAMLEGRAQLEVPFERIITQLLFFMALPVALGMVLREKKGEWICRHQKALQRVNSILLLVVIVYSFNVDEGIDVKAIAQAFPYALTFIASSACLGLLFSMLFRQNWHDRKALLLEFSIHSTAIPTLLIAGVFQQLSWLAFIGAAAGLQMTVALCIVLYKHAFDKTLRDSDTEQGV